MFISDSTAKWVHQFNINTFQLYSQVAQLEWVAHGKVVTHKTLIAATRPCKATC